MLQIARLTDYSILLLTHLASKGKAELLSCSQLADETHLPEPTVRKVLKTLAGHDLLDSKRGAHGGYRLAREAERISVAEVIEAMEGPVGLTVCSQETGECELEAWCGTSANWQRINEEVLRTLERISVADMVGPLPTRVLEGNERRAPEATAETAANHAQRSSQRP